MGGRRRYLWRAVDQFGQLIELGISDLNTTEAYADTVDLVIELAPDLRHAELAQPTYVSADVDPATRSIAIYTFVANPTHTLRPGMNVQVLPVSDETARHTAKSGE